MLTILTDVFKNFKIAALVPILVFLFKLFIDNINIRGVEKKVLLTNLKRFYIQVSNVFLFTIIFAVIIGIFGYKSQDIIIKDPHGFFIYTIVCIGYTSLIIIPIYICEMFLINIVSFKTRYYIYLEKDKDKKWFISRKLNNKTILLCDEFNNYRFFAEDINTYIIYSVLQEKPAYIFNIYNFVAKRKWLLIGILTLIYFVLSSFITDISGIYKIICFVIICFLIFSIFTIIIISKNMTNLKGISSSINIQS